jgi:hypothetical protein
MQSDLTIERDLDYLGTADRSGSSVNEINALRHHIRDLTLIINELRRRNAQQRDWMLQAEHLNGCLGHECDCKLDELLNDREPPDVN